MSIGVPELQEPLIGLGFAETINEVENMVNQVDADGSGVIEFDEFLGIIKNADKDQGTREITDFFKKLTSGEIGSKDISFSLFV